MRRADRGAVCAGVCCGAAARANSAVDSRDCGSRVGMCSGGILFAESACCGSADAGTESSVGAVCRYGTGGMARDVEHGGDGADCGEEYNFVRSRYRRAEGVGVTAGGPGGGGLPVYARVKRCGVSAGSNRGKRADDGGVLPGGEGTGADCAREGGAGKSETAAGGGEEEVGEESEEARCYPACSAAISARAVTTAARY